MSTYRHRFRIVLDGVKHEVTTSARDLASAGIKPGETPNLMDLQLRMLHAACVRLGLSDIPSDYLTFADLLDDIDDLEPETPIDDAPDPTRATV